MNILVTGGAGFDLRIKQHTLKRHQEVAAEVGRATGTERTVTGTSRS